MSMALVVFIASSDSSLPPGASFVDRPDTPHAG